MFAATAAGIFEKVEMAMDAMGQGFDNSYHPDPKKIPVYKSRYQKYGELGQFIERHTGR
jgi:L-ribulokinase